jgi:hypothetical protein
MTNDAVSEVYYRPIHRGELWGGAPHRAARRGDTISYTHRKSTHC